MKTSLILSALLALTFAGCQSRLVDTTSSGFTFHKDKDSATVELTNPKNTQVDELTFDPNTGEIRLLGLKTDVDATAVNAAAQETALITNLLTRSMVGVLQTAMGTPPTPEPSLAEPLPNDGDASAGDPQPEE